MEVKKKNYRYVQLRKGKEVLITPYNKAYMRELYKEGYRYEISFNVTM